MLSKHTLVAALLAASCTLAHAAPETRRLFLMTEAHAASSVHGARPSGIDADKVGAIMARAGIAYTVEALPWKRAYAAALKRPDACVFSTSRTAEREPLFHWIGPLDEAQWVLMGRADRHLRLRTLEDARGYRIGTQDGDARDQYLRANGMLVESAPNELLNAPKLLANRIDLWAASLHRGSTLLAQHGWRGQVVPLLVFKRVPVYLACNRDVGADLVARLDAAVAALERDGTMRQIERRYEDAAAAAHGGAGAPAAPR
jgi:polar amino acid transport system substrate-binding protein